MAWLSLATRRKLLVKCNGGPIMCVDAWADWVGVNRIGHLVIMRSSAEYTTGSAAHVLPLNRPPEGQTHTCIKNISIGFEMILKYICGRYIFIERECNSRKLCEFRRNMALTRVKTTQMEKQQQLNIQGGEHQAVCAALGLQHAIRSFL